MFSLHSKLCLCDVSIKTMCPGRIELLERCILIMFSLELLSCWGAMDVGEQGAKDCKALRYAESIRTRTKAKQFSTQINKLNCILQAAI